MSKNLMDAGDAVKTIRNQPKTILSSFPFQPWLYCALCASRILCKPMQISVFKCFCASCLFFLKGPRHLSCQKKCGVLFKSGIYELKISWSLLSCSLIFREKLNLGVFQGLKTSFALVPPLSNFPNFSNSHLHHSTKISGSSTALCTSDPPSLSLSLGKRKKTKKV